MHLFFLLSQKVVTALDRTWHPEHFFCAQCGAFFGPEGRGALEGPACHALGRLRRRWGDLPMVGLGWLQVYLSELHPLPILRLPREGRQSLLSERLL